MKGATKASSASTSPDVGSPTAAKRPRSERIIELLRRHGRPYDGHPDQATARASGCFFGPADPAVGALLTRNFPPDDLQADGVCTQDSDGGWQLAADLTDDAGPLIVVTFGGTAGRQALVTSSRVLFAQGCALRAAFFDDWTRDRMTACSRLLLLTPPGQHAACFRSAGLPAMPWTGLRQLPWNELLQITLRCRDAVAKRAVRPTTTAAPAPLIQPSTREDVERKTASAIALGEMEVADQLEDGRAPGASGSPPITLVLVGWSPYGWRDEDESELVETARFVAVAARNAPCSAPRFAVWRPADPDLLSGALHHCRPEEHGAYLLQSVRADLIYPQHYLDTVDSPPGEAGYAAALMRLREVETYHGGFHDAEEVATRRADVRAAIDREFVTPLLAMAADSKSPLQRTGYAAAAETTRVLMRTGLAMHDALAAVEENPTPEALARLAAISRVRDPAVRQTLQWVRELRRE